MFRFCLIKSQALGELSDVFTAGLSSLLTDKPKTTCGYLWELLHCLSDWLLAGINPKPGFLLCVLLHRRARGKVTSTQTLNIRYRTRRVGIRALSPPAPQPQRVQSKFSPALSSELFWLILRLLKRGWVTPNLPRCPGLSSEHKSSKSLNYVLCVIGFLFFLCLKWDWWDSKCWFHFRMREDSARVYENVGLMQQQKSFRWEDVQSLPGQGRCVWPQEGLCPAWLGRKCTQECPKCLEFIPRGCLTSKN